MRSRTGFQRGWPYLRNTLLFFGAGTPGMILAGTALWLVGQYSPMSFSMFLLAQTKQAYLISVYVGPLLSVIHTYLLQHTEIRAPRTRLGQSVWYATLLGLLTTLSLFPFLPSGYDARCDLLWQREWNARHALSRVHSSACWRGALQAFDLAVHPQRRIFHRYRPGARYCWSLDRAKSRHDSRKLLSEREFYSFAFAFSARGSLFSGSINCIPEPCPYFFSFARIWSLR